MYADIHQDIYISNYFLHNYDDSRDYRGYYYGEFIIMSNCFDCKFWEEVERDMGCVYGTCINPLRGDTEEPVEITDCPYWEAVE